MFFSIGDKLECKMKKDEAGYQGGWWACTLIAKKGARYQISYETIVKKRTRAPEQDLVPLTRLRYSVPDDHDDIPPHARNPGDAVDVWDFREAWWEGYVVEVWDDRCSVYFPIDPDVYINLAANDLEGRRVRTAMRWNVTTWKLEPKKPKFFENYKDHRGEGRKEGEAGARASSLLGHAREKRRTSEVVKEPSSNSAETTENDDMAGPSPCAHEEEEEVEGAAAAKRRRCFNDVIVSCSSLAKSRILATFRRQQGMRTESNDERGLAVAADDTDNAETLLREAQTSLPSQPPNAPTLSARPAPIATAVVATSLLPIAAPAPAQYPVLGPLFCMASNNLSLVWCLDNLPPWLTSEALRTALKAVVKGVVRITVASTKLDCGASHAGYAVVVFANAAAAAEGAPVLRRLCLAPSRGCPLPRPLLAHRPLVGAKQHSWGASAQMPGHLQLDLQHGGGAAASSRFAQPDTLEFEMALDWRALERVVGVAQGKLHARQARELAEVLAGCELGGSSSSSSNARLLDAAAFERPPPVPSPPPSCCVWLQGVAPQVQQADVLAAFSQFGRPVGAEFVRDQVTSLHTGHAVVQMESPEAAAAVVRNLEEMVFMLKASPRPVKARVARVGGASGSQSVFDRALQGVFGRWDCEAPAGGVVRLVQVAEEWEEEGSDEQGKVSPAQRRAVQRARGVLRRQLERDQVGARAVARRERAALAGRHEELYWREKAAEQRLAALRHSQVFQALAGFHGVVA